MKNRFVVTYFFTSSNANGNDYTRQLTIEASTRMGAETIARIEGFREFGGRFNDNCHDWRITPLELKQEHMTREV